MPRQLEENILSVNVPHVALRRRRLLDLRRKKQSDARRRNKKHSTFLEYVVEKMDVPWSFVACAMLRINYTFGSDKYVDASHLLFYPTFLIWAAIEPVREAGLAALAASDRR